jgi:hypothetical protein
MPRFVGVFGDGKVTEELDGTEKEGANMSEQTATTKDPQPPTQAAGEKKTVSPPSVPPETPSRLGEFLIGAGSVGMFAMSLMSRSNHGGAIAAALFVVIVGLVIKFPTLLQDGSATDQGTAAVSAMRVSLLLVVSVFAILTVKAGWASVSLDSLKIDQSWAMVLGAALTGKVVQSFAENTPPKDKP